MVKSVSGYLTKDGRFFTDENAAELNEAEEALIEQLEKITFHAGPIMMDSGRMVSTIYDYRTLIMRYIHAKDRTNPREAHVGPRLDGAPKTSRRKSPEVIKGSINNRPSEEGVKSV